MPSPIELRLLGRFSAARIEAAKESVSISVRKARGLLAYLATHPDGVAARETLADLLWGDRVDAQARQNLRQCLVALRRDLDPVAPGIVIAETETVGIRRDLLVVDVAEFERLAGSAEVDDLERAAALYGGPFLAGLDLETEGFEEWVLRERNRLERLFAEVLVRCAEMFDARGDGERAIAHAERLVALDPLREDWQRRLIRLIARHRGREAALAHGKSVAEGLERELGTKPEPETAALLHEIRKSSAAPASLRVAPEPVDPRPPARQLIRHSRAPLAAATTLAAAVIAAVTLSGADSRSPEAPPPQEAAPANPRPTLADRGFAPLIVLPFSAPSGSAEDRARAEALTDDLITLLSRVPRIRVVARQTAEAYRDRGADLAALDREFGLSYALEGSIRREGETVVANIRLVNLRNRLQVWSRSYVRPIAAATGGNSELLLGMARELQIAVFDAEADYESAAHGPGHTRALLARAFARTMHHTTREDRVATRAILEEVLRREPANVNALMTLISIIAGQLGALQSSDPEQDLARCAELLERARVLAPRAAIRHFFQGRYFMARQDVAAALAEFERSLEINPSHAGAIAHRGYALIRLDRLEEAKAAIEKAMRLSPNDPDVSFWFGALGDIELEMGPTEAAFDLYRLSVAKQPNNARAHLRLAAAYVLAGDRNAATRHVRKFRNLATPAHESALAAPPRSHEAATRPPLKIDHAIRQALILPR